MNEVECKKCKKIGALSKTPYMKSGARKCQFCGASGDDGWLIFRFGVVKKITYTNKKWKSPNYTMKIRRK
jgi:hypothetical protein